MTLVYFDVQLVKKQRDEFIDIVVLQKHEPIDLSHETFDEELYR